MSEEGEVIEFVFIMALGLICYFINANTTTEADLCVCYGLIDNAENLLPKCKMCKALVWNAEKTILERMKDGYNGD